MVKIKLNKETRDLQEDAQAKVTKNNYQGDWLKFISYVKNEHNCHPLDVDDNESAYALVSNYIEWIYQNINAKIFKGISEKEDRKKISQKQNPYYKTNYKASTVQRILAAITYNYRNHQLSEKSENFGKSILFDRQNIDINKTISSIVRKDKDKKVGQAKELLKKDIIKIIDSINKDSEDLADIRDEALILIGFYSFCRRSEVLNMKYEDLTFNNDSITVSIKYSKTDQKGKGRQVLLPKKDDRYCPVKSLKKWIEIAQIANGPLFYKITKSKNKASFERIRKYELNKRTHLNVSLSDHSFNLILKKRSTNAGLDDSEISAHSLRIGAITEARNMGIPIHEIMAQSGHSTSQMIDHYSKISNIRDTSAAKKI